MSTVVVVGLGLMGGSLAGAIKASASPGRVLGVEPDPESARIALDRKLIDELVSEIPADADLIVLCTPSDLVAERVVELKDHAGVVIDVGSVKGAIVRRVIEAIGALPPRFVPCHPVAGSEKSGPGAADPGLFAGCTVVLTPGDVTSAAALETARAFWEKLGAATVLLSAEAHDAALATTSHLPHLLAFAFMGCVADEHLAFAGGGFRDFTRIAAANPELWWRILQMNREELLAAGRAFAGELDDLMRLIEQGDAGEGRRRIEAAAAKRARLDGG